MSASRIVAAVALVTVLAAGVAFVSKFDGASVQETALGAADVASFSMRMQGVKAGNPVVSAQSQDSLWGSAVDAERRSLMGYYYYTPTPTPAPEWEGGPWFEYANPMTDLANKDFLIKMTYDEATATYTTCHTSDVGNYPEKPWGDLQDLSSGAIAQVFGPFDVSATEFKRIKFGGEKYFSFWASTNGFISFEEPNVDFRVSKNAFFSVPMAAPLLTKLNPATIGNTKLKVKVTKNRIIITWNKFGQLGKEHNHKRHVSMQFVMNKKGDMQFYYDRLKINAESVVGLSAGGDRPRPLVGELDFTTAAAC
mmetsp:Transcript_37486/g.105848  ORF Transcript_37486/g.105848 Transcript_37486/m.105848 type:complete len:309 (+) Transcript_37486:81-1007(+)|eukprot:CAMPEP_0117688978 /NCGR_PEP_ID=MMETSP0804-20121206/24186_1 /TAXON_ID=1074897 /ORGANISM="Tetraselmis astigmatica, Strain CCMP880" /LENGTH=308 /DNA_ID=CAMNT_0005501603 /DNA_START=33 /DNA_END=959 /DNA_ORIENTATION=+